MVPTACCPPDLKLSVADNTTDGIDGSAETDGLAVATAARPGYPMGTLNVQDGANMGPSEPQNRQIADGLQIDAQLSP